MHFCQAAFDVFDIEHRDEWKLVKEQFYVDVAAIECEAKNFIDASFKTLRSAEGAFEMLLNFKHIRSRDSINSQMMRKFNDILAQFDKEVVASIRTFYWTVSGKFMWQQNFYISVYLLLNQKLSFVTQF